MAVISYLCILSGHVALVVWFYLLAAMSLLLRILRRTQDYTSKTAQNRRWRA